MAYLFVNLLNDLLFKVTFINLGEHTCMWRSKSTQTSPVPPSILGIKFGLPGLVESIFTYRTISPALLVDIFGGARQQEGRRVSRALTESSHLETQPSGRES